jgi:Ca2+-binding EF-hand superfamily protein
LNSSATFNVYDAFKAVDVDDNGKITGEELRQIIEKNGFYVSLPEIKALIERYDSKNYL